MTMRKFPLYPASWRWASLACCLAALLYSCAWMGVPMSETGDRMTRIARKWDYVKATTIETWVEYSDTLDTRGTVDFAKGKMEVETILPETDGDVGEAANRNLLEHIEKIFKTEDGMGQSILDGQVRNAQGKLVTPENLGIFIRDEVTPSVADRRKHYVARDGVKRVKMKAEISLVPDHIQVRALRYAGVVRRYAARHGLPAHLVMAIIHKESIFNPRARSYCGAIGLMQLMPESGGREALRHLNGRDEIPSEEDLMDSDSNILMGTAYYWLLENHYFKSVASRVKRRYLAICAYNMGPSRLRGMVGDNGIESLSDGSAYDLLRKKTPRQTGNYLEEVTRLTEEYERLLKTRPVGELASLAGIFTAFTFFMTSMTPPTADVG